MKARELGVVVVLAFTQCGCRSAYYATLEKFGVCKRDLLKKSVTAARDGQSQAAEQFKDALKRLRELYPAIGVARLNFLSDPASNLL